MPTTPSPGNPPLSASSSATPTLRTADPNASPTAQSLLAWTRSLANRNSRRVVLGQQVWSWGDPNDKYFIDRLKTLTGRRPAMIGSGYHTGWKDSNLPPLLRHWDRGGLVTFEWHPADPWRGGGEETAWVNNGAGARAADAPKNDLRRLLADAPASPAKTKWQTERAKMADVLTQLADHGVVVILRLLHEQNGSWFWWGQDVTTRHTAVVDLYRDTARYLRDDRGLHNLLYCFSPAPSWDGKATQYYPGDSEVDLVGPTRYHDTLKLLGPELRGEENHDDWVSLRGLGKPIGYGEFGPDPTRDGRWDSRTLLTRLRENYPQMVWAHSWHGWDNLKVELVAQRHISDLMNDPLIITLETIDWNRP